MPAGPGLLLLLLGLTGFLRAHSGGLPARPACVPGFSEEGYTALVSPDLVEGQKLLQVKFSGCSRSMAVWYKTSNLDYKVKADGTVFAARKLQIPSKHDTFVVAAWDNQTPDKWETTVRLLVDKNESKHRELKQEGNLNPSPDVWPPPRSTLLPWRQHQELGGLRRQKRDWVIPPVNVPENSRGPFPEQLVRMEGESLEKRKPIQYQSLIPKAVSCLWPLAIESE